MSEVITLTMTREQARAVMDATELLARLEIGQFKEICWKMLDRFTTDDNKFDGDRRDRTEEILELAARTMFGTKNGWLNISEKSIQHNRCWAIYATIRYVLSWHDHPEGGITVNFDEPLGYGEPMPKCEVINDEQKDAAVAKGKRKA